MIGRNTIRIKVMQALYEYNMSEHHSTPSIIEKNLLRSFQDMYALYIRMLAIFGALTYMAGQITELKKQKFFPTETELYPSFKFIDNTFVKKIEENTSLQKVIRETHLGWDNDVKLLFIRKIYDALSNQDFFIQYLQNPDISTFETDKKLILTILEKFMLENAEMIHYFGEIKLSWLHDYNDVVILVHNTLKSFTKKQSDDKAIPPLFKIAEDGISEDYHFMQELLRKTIKNDEQYSQIIALTLQNWDIERIACIDLILLKMAICEFCEFPSVPLRVTLNEYIEISKYYSTPKSRYFINGLLDTILSALKDENKINKQGRGLMG
jgi:N utilization substance protein B